MNLRSPYLSIFLLALIYIFFNNENVNIDSWYYAACVKYNRELYNSHHLFYNAFARQFYIGLHFVFPSIEVLRSMQVMNALAAFFSLLALYNILLKVSQNPKNALLFTLFCGFSFGFMRFATDAETYILPVLFSLLSTHLIIVSSENPRYFLSGVCAALAVLFHQVHLWWTLSLFFYVLFEKTIVYRQKERFTIALALIPFSYLGIYMFANNDRFGGFWNFILGTYHNGHSHLDFSGKAALLTLINLFRTLFQVHGDIIAFVKHFKFAWISMALVCALLLMRSFKGLQISLSKKLKVNKLANYLLIGIGLQIAFAFLSSGNAEFMVMLPFMAVIVLFLKYDFHFTKSFFFILPAILIWNLSNGVLPAKYLSINKFEHQVELTTKGRGQFYWVNKTLIENQVNYKMGFKRPYSITSLEGMDTSSINFMLQRKTKVYTDMGLKEASFSRRTITGVNTYNQIIELYTKEIVDSYDNIYGKNYIYRLLPKK